MTDKTKIHALPDREQDKYEANREKMRRLMQNKEGMREEVQFAAEMRKMHYDALREIGFNENQALTIIAKMF